MYAINKEDVDTANNTFDKLDTLGSYRPYFAHSPYSAARPKEIYPQILKDLSTLMEIVDMIISYLDSRKA